MKEQMVVFGDGAKRSQMTTIYNRPKDRAPPVRALSMIRIKTKMQNVIFDEGLISLWGPEYNILYKTKHIDNIEELNWTPAWLVHK